MCKCPRIICPWCKCLEGRCPGVSVLGVSVRGYMSKFLFVLSPVEFYISLLGIPFQKKVGRFRNVSLSCQHVIKL